VRVVAVPVKALERSKSRLAPMLSPAERAVLALAMLEDVLTACLAQDGWDVWSISSDQAVLETAARHGARPVAESGHSLAAAVSQVESLVSGRRDALAVVLGDLPLLSARALRDALGRRAPVVAAPARSDGGTNVLVRRPAAVIPARFGGASFARHRWAAHRRRTAFEEVRDPALAFDLDRPGDIGFLLARGDARSRTWRACRELELEARLQVRAGAV
jgi:2-phospho-L-lactate guanylyltransferase